MINQNEKVCSVLSQYQVTATIEALERAGLPLEGFNLFRSDKKFINNVARYAINLMLGSEKLDSQILSLINDGNYFGPADWLKFYGIKSSNFKLPISINELKIILNKDCPFTTGKKIKETHCLFYLPSYWGEEPLSINKWKELYRVENKILFHGPNDFTWLNYEDFYFSNMHAHQNWYLMFAGAIPGLIGHNFTQQKTIFDEIGYEFAETIEVVSMFLLFWEKNKRSAEEEEESYIGGRTSGINSEPNHIVVSTSGKMGREIYIHEGRDWNLPNIGAYAFKKL